ncbi:Fungalysin metallopeptidase-domain-containing protein [Amylostereum chailletii]|nr:Fungalysin metallopeptidase-domain-containing protein [Amylostereum chailletii]
MARFALLLSSIIIALAFVSSAVAALGPTSFKHATHRVRTVGPDAVLTPETFHPASSFETFGTHGLDHSWHSMAKHDNFNFTSAATAFVASRLGIDTDTVAFTSGFVGDVSKHAFIETRERRASPAPPRDISSGIVDYAGIRTHPYSHLAAMNPLTYADIGTPNEVHDIGEVWANILHNVLASLVNAHGFDSDALFDPTSTAGNTVYTHIFIDSLAIQPCNPTSASPHLLPFLSFHASTRLTRATCYMISPTARDTWIQADANRFGGANVGTRLWDAFASRDLGVNAANHPNDTTMPAGC